MLLSCVHVRRHTKAGKLLCGAQWHFYIPPHTNGAGKCFGIANLKITLLSCAHACRHAKVGKLLCGDSGIFKAS